MCDGGYNDDDPTIALFWDYVAKIDEGMRRQLLLFWSGTSRPPCFGFCPKDSSGDEIEWSIRKPEGGAGRSRGGRRQNQQELMLPSACVCDRVLYLPEFRTAEQLESAIHICLEFGAVGYYKA